MTKATLRNRAAISGEFGIAGYRRQMAATVTRLDTIETVAFWATRLALVALIGGIGGYLL